MQEHEDEYIRTKFQQTELSKGEFNTQKTDGRVIKYHLFLGNYFCYINSCNSKLGKGPTFSYP